MREVVDTETAREFMKETLDVVDIEELARIATELCAKSRLFDERLGGDRWRDLSEKGYAELVERIFSARRKRKAFHEQFRFEEMRDWIGELIHGGDDVQARFQTFVDRTDALPEKTRCDFASELLHFTAPDKHWLWTRWMWDPRARTGSLPLVTSATYDLTGDSPGEIYMKVGRGSAFVHEVGDGAGFRRISKTIFGTDVFLCCVYVIYAYTVLRMRMTKEFNKVMPELAQFCRRLLGVHRKQPRERAASGA